MDFLTGAFAAVGAGFFTNPLEVVKIRMQLQGELLARGQYTVHYKNFLHAFYQLAKQEGILSVQKGLVPALWYQVCLNGVRLGGYAYMENRGFIVDDKGRFHVVNGAIVGALAGCAGAYIGSPFYLVKMHLQSQSKASIAVGYQHDVSGMTQGLLRVYREHGIRGLWRGASSGVPRAAVGSASQIVAFYLCKETMAPYEYFRDRPVLSTFISSLSGGLFISIMMTPLDVVMTRVYNQGVDVQGRGLQYTSLLDCFGKIWKTEGFRGFYKGFWANYARLGPHTVLCFVFWDMLRRLEADIFDLPPPKL